MEKRDFLEAEHRNGDPVPQQPHRDRHDELEDEQCDNYQDGSGEDTSDFIHSFVLFDVDDSLPA